MVINKFRGEYEFLSNFYPSKIEIGGLVFENAEAAFQSAKVTDIETKMKFCSLNPSEAKRLGRRVNLRPDWEVVKDAVMLQVVMEKFFQNAPLAKKLINTEYSALIEGNDWGDKYWGVCDGVGENKLGKILMLVRAELEFDKS